MQETITNLWQIASPILLAVIGYFLRDLHARINKDVSALKDEVGSLKASLPLNYVLREDYIRTAASMERKLDKILEIQAERRL